MEKGVETEVGLLAPTTKILQPGLRVRQWEGVVSTFSTWFLFLACPSPRREDIEQHSACPVTLNTSPECLMKPSSLSFLGCLSPIPPAPPDPALGLKGQHHHRVGRPSPGKEQTTLCLNGLGDSGRTGYPVHLLAV